MDTVIIKSIVTRTNSTNMCGTSPTFLLRSLVTAIRNMYLSRQRNIGKRIGMITPIIVSRLPVSYKEAIKQIGSVRSPTRSRMCLASVENPPIPTTNLPSWE